LLTAWIGHEDPQLITLLAVYATSQ